ncbi:MAG: efflux RND transporter permease subunit, partial [Vicinamibacterales bacterium]
LLTVPALFAASRVGSDFMPQLDEGALLLQTILPPEASLDEVDRLNHRVEDLLREFPEVDDVVRRTGRAEATEDPMPHTVSDVLVILKDDRARSPEELEGAMRERLASVPGVAVLFTTPLGMRIDEGLGGTPADISVRIFGPELDTLAQLAAAARTAMSQVPGISDLRAEELTGLPQLRIVVDREATARVGLAPGDVIRAVRIGLVGEEASEMWIGQKRFDLVVRLQDDKRDDINAIRSLLIDSHDGTRIPLGQLASVEQAFGPGAIRREAGSRRIAVEAGVSGRDLGSVAADVQTAVARLTMPAGYFFTVGGRVESQTRAAQALVTAIAVALLAVVLLLYLALNSFLDAALILVTIPVAFIGGIVALLL